MSHDVEGGPNEPLGFEISPQDEFWNFIPDYYPSDFTQMKKRELDRYGGNCNGESVSIKSIKNRVLHVKGILGQDIINIFHRLIEYDGKVDVVSPLLPNGGLECHLKRGELGNQKGWDPQTDQRLFEYNLDLVSTGRDEHGDGKNGIVTAIIPN